LRSGRSRLIDWVLPITSALNGISQLFACIPRKDRGYSEIDHLSSMRLILPYKSTIPLSSHGGPFMDFDIQPNNFSPSRTPIITLINQINRKLTSSITPSIVDGVKLTASIPQSRWIILVFIWRKLTMLVLLSNLQSDCMWYGFNSIKSSKSKSLSKDKSSWRIQRR
jgi:hypothetical protein